MEKILALYIRPSAFSNSYDEQREVLRKAFQKEHASVQEFAEAEVGFLRPQLDLLMDKVQTGKIIVFAVASIDRLDLASTSESDFFAFLHTLTDNGVRFVSVKEGLDSLSPAGDFFRKLGPAVDEAHEIVRRERIVLSLKKSKDEGQHLGRPRVADYGAIRALRQTGLSIQMIADQLNISRGAVQHCLKTIVEQDIGPA